MMRLKANGTIAPMLPRSHAPTLPSSRSFTLVELVVTITVMAILAAIAVPKFVNTPKLRRAAHELTTHIKLARDLAIAAQRHTWIVFNTTNDSYSVYIEDPDNPGRANRIFATHPLTGGNFTVTLNTGQFAGVVINTASFGSGTELEFDWSGIPYDGNAQPLATDGTAVLAANTTRTVRVACQTGHVEEE